MATINEVLERTARVRPDAFDERTRAGWLLELEGKLLREVVLRHRGGGEPERIAERYPEDGNVPLLAPPPYDNLYDLYVFAQTDLFNRETENYNVSAQLFNAALDEYKKDYHARHEPLGAGYYANVF